MGFFPLSERNVIKFFDPLTLKIENFEPSTCLHNTIPVIHSHCFKFNLFIIILNAFQLFS